MIVQTVRNYQIDTSALLIFCSGWTFNDHGEITTSVSREVWPLFLYSWHLMGKIYFYTSCIHFLNSAYAS